MQYEPRTDGVSIAGSANQTNLQPRPAALDVVAEQTRRFIVVRDYEILIAIIVVIGQSQSAAVMRLAQVSRRRKRAEK